MNKLYLLLVFLLSTFMDIQGQVVAVKTNVLYDERRGGGRVQQALVG